MFVCTISIPVQRMMRPVGRSTYTSLARVRAALTGMACLFGYRLHTTDEAYLQRHEGRIVGAVSKARVVTERVNQPPRS